MTNYIETLTKDATTWAKDCLKNGVKDEDIIEDLQIAFNIDEESAVYVLGLAKLDVAE